jgi:hypothetical protein
MVFAKERLPFVDGLPCYRLVNDEATLGIHANAFAAYNYPEEPSRTLGFVIQDVLLVDAAAPDRKMI